ERASRTLVEEFQTPVEALLWLASAAGGAEWDRAEVEGAEMALIGGVLHMLNVAADTQLEGRAAGIDAVNLVDALDTLCAIGLQLGARGRGIAGGRQQTVEALEARFSGWLGFL